MKTKAKKTAPATAESKPKKTAPEKLTEGQRAILLSELRRAWRINDLIADRAKALQETIQSETDASLMRIGRALGLDDEADLEPALLGYSSRAEMDAAAEREAEKYAARDRDRAAKWFGKGATP